MKQPILPMQGFPSRTISIACTDVAQALPAAQMIENGRPVIAILISCEENGMRFTFGDAVPVIATNTGHVMYPGYNFLMIENPYAINTFQFCNAGAGLNSIAHITFMFEGSVI